ncbi:hypothetical protein [Candidatus Odyssella thessalonicensis]|uniref:hypothetical protein n=1 Tax=Candidatus Odyssella thessalonicensis TaxID=84647 RepID=UPI001111A17D|nr:hypothetical protein [Candidatus Odyssella thessalonicensis]
MINSLPMKLSGTIELLLEDLAGSAGEEDKYGNFSNVSKKVGQLVLKTMTRATDIRDSSIGVFRQEGEDEEGLKLIYHESKKLLEEMPSLNIKEKISMVNHILTKLEREAARFDIVQEFRSSEEDELRNGLTIAFRNLNIVQKVDRDLREIPFPPLSSSLVDSQIDHAPSSLFLEVWGDIPLIDPTLFQGTLFDDEELLELERGASPLWEGRYTLLRHRKVGLNSSYKPTSIYFHRNTTLAWQGHTLHNRSYYEENPLNKLPFISKIWSQQAALGQYKINHLACNIFCIVRNDYSEIETYESPIFCEILDGIADKKKYKFEVTRDGKSGKGLAVIDFASGVPHPRIIESLERDNFITYTRSNFQVNDNDITYHGDLLALYSLTTNPDLFFKLLTKNGHIDNYEILGLGTRFFSSYDACNDCNNKIYKKIYTGHGLKADLCNRARRHYSYQGHELPFHTLFYAYRPFTNGCTYYLRENSKDTKYTTHAVTNYGRSYTEHTFSLRGTEPGKEFKPHKEDLITPSEYYNISNSDIIYSHVAYLERIQYQ